MFLLQFIWQQSKNLQDVNIRDLHKLFDTKSIIFLLNLSYLSLSVIEVEFKQLWIHVNEDISSSYLPMLNLMQHF